MQKNQPRTVRAQRNSPDKLFLNGYRLPAVLLLIGLAVGAVYYLSQPTTVKADVGGLVISQVYGGAGCGTAGCSTYQNDYIEIYNRSTSPVTCTNCSVQYSSATGSAWSVTALPPSLTIQPGKYYLVAEAFGANGVSPIPTADTTGSIAMSATAAKVALVNATSALSGTCPALNGPGTPAILDFVGYGATASCSETAVAPAPSTTTADIRGGGGNSDTQNNAADFQAAAPNPRNSATAANTPTDSSGVVSGRIGEASGAPIAGATVRMIGMQTRKTITDASGHYRFENVASAGFYTVAVSHPNFSFSPSERSFSQLGASTEAGFIGAPVAGGNPLDTPEYFVRQHYVDFLGREPDESGFNFWSDQINECGNDANCLERRTINVSAAYFLSAEFQETGGLLDRLYKASYGRSPRYSEFMPDRATIARDVVVGRSGWQQLLAANRESFIDNWVERTAFHTAFDSLSDEAYVDALLENTEINFPASERDSLVNSLSSRTLSRAEVLEQIADHPAFARARFNEAFVRMEYFGYLRRDPDSSGLHFWLDKLNQFDGNFERAEMVKAFLVSGEYRARFQ